MKANELMLGNYVDKSGDICKLASINTDNTIKVFSNDETDTWGSFALRIFKPISLTEKWLLDFGFTSKKKNYYKKNNLRIMIYDGVFFIEDWHDGCLEIKSVHQLQNLYFSLTGNHLQLVAPK